MLPFRSKNGRWEMGCLRWSVRFCACVCIYVYVCGWALLQMNAVEEKYNFMKRESRVGSGPFGWKGRPNSSNFQANQRGTGWTLIGWSEGCERSPKGYRGHCSTAQITCPSFLQMTYPCKVSRRAIQKGVINVSVLHTFCVGEPSTAFTENRHNSSGQDRNWPHKNR